MHIIKTAIRQRCICMCYHFNSVENVRLRMHAYAINYSLKLAISFNLFLLNYLSICITYVRRRDGFASLNVSLERNAVINF